MRRKSFAEMSCSLAQCLEIVGERWTLLIVRDAFFGVTRFDAFEARLGIARNVLADRLEHLVAHGVFERVPYQDRPVRYDYRLTAKGRDLWLVVTAMRQWGDRWAAPAGPPVELVHVGCGGAGHEETTTVVPVCARCGEPLRPGAMRAAAGPGGSDPDSLPLVGAAR